MIANNLANAYRKISKDNSFKICLVDSLGNTTPIDSSKMADTVQDILPENLSDYFFFWGERIEKLSDKILFLSLTTRLMQHR